MGVPKRIQPGSCNVSDLDLAMHSTGFTQRIRPGFRAFMAGRPPGRRKGGPGRDDSARRWRLPGMCSRQTHPTVKRPANPGAGPKAVQPLCASPPSSAASSALAFSRRFPPAGYWSLSSDAWAATAGFPAQRSFPRAQHLRVTRTRPTVSCAGSTMTLHTLRYNGLRYARTRVARASKTRDPGQEGTLPARRGARPTREGRNRDGDSHTRGGRGDIHHGERSRVYVANGARRAPA